MRYWWILVVLGLLVGFVKGDVEMFDGPDGKEEVISARKGPVFVGTNVEGPATAERLKLDSRIQINGEIRVVEGEVETPKERARRLQETTPTPPPSQPPPILPATPPGPLPTPIPTTKGEETEEESELLRKLPVVESVEVAKALHRALRAKAVNVLLFGNATVESEKVETVVGWMGELEAQLTDCRTRADHETVKTRRAGESPCFDEERALAAMRRALGEAKRREEVVQELTQGKVGLARCSDGSNQCPPMLAGWGVFVKPEIGQLVPKGAEFSYPVWFADNALARVPIAMESGDWVEMGVVEKGDVGALELCGGDGCALDRKYSFAKLHPRAQRLSQKLRSQLPPHSRYALNPIAIFQGTLEHAYGANVQHHSELPAPDELLEVLEVDPDHFPVGQAARVDDALLHIRNTLKLPAIVSNDYIRRIPSILQAGQATIAMERASHALLRHWPRVYAEKKATLHVAPFGMHKIIMPLRGAIRVKVVAPDDQSLVYASANRTFPSDLNLFAIPSNIDPYGLSRGGGRALSKADADLLFITRKYPSALLAHCTEFYLAPGTFLFVPASAPSTWQAVDQTTPAVVIEHAFLDASVVSHVRSELLHSAGHRDIEQGLLDFLNLPSADLTLHRTPEPLSIQELHTPVNGIRWSGEGGGVGGDDGKGSEVFSASLPAAGGESEVVEGEVARLEGESDGAYERRKRLLSRTKANLPHRPSHITNPQWVGHLKWHDQIASLTRPSPSTPLALGTGRRNITLTWKGKPEGAFILAWSKDREQEAEELKKGEVEGGEKEVKKKRKPKFNPKRPNFNIAGARFFEVKREGDGGEVLESFKEHWDESADVLRKAGLSHKLARPAARALAGATIEHALFLKRSLRPKDHGYFPCAELGDRALLLSMDGAIEPEDGAIPLCVTISELEPDSNFVFRVAHVEEKSVSAWSDVSLPARTLPLTTSFPPQSVQAERVSSTKARVSWDPPVDDGGTLLLGYVLLLDPVAARGRGRRESPRGHVEQIVAFLPTTRGLVVSGLMPGVQYHASVGAVTALGVSTLGSTTNPIAGHPPEGTKEEESIGAVHVGIGGDAAFTLDLLGIEAAPPSQTVAHLGNHAAVTLQARPPHPHSPSSFEVPNALASSGVTLGSTIHAMVARIALATLDTIKDPAAALIRSALLDSKTQQYVDIPALPKQGFSALGRLLGLPATELSTLQHTWHLITTSTLPSSTTQLHKPSSSIANAAAGSEEPCAGPVAVVSDTLRRVSLLSESATVRVAGWESHVSPRKFDVRAELVASIPLTGMRPNRGKAENAARFRRRIVLFERGGNVPLSHKVRQAMEEGALAVVIFDNTGRCDNDKFNQACVPGSDISNDDGFAALDPLAAWKGLDRIPTLLISRTSGESLLAKLGVKYKHRPNKAMGMGRRVVRADERVRNMLGEERGGHGSVDDEL